jgi:hypothetical protein
MKVVVGDDVDLHTVQSESGSELNEVKNIHPAMLEEQVTGFRL